MYVPDTSAGTEVLDHRVSNVRRICPTGTAPETAPSSTTRPLAEVRIGSQP